MGTKEKLTKKDKTLNNSSNINSKAKIEKKPFVNKIALPTEIFGLEKIYEQAIFDTIMMERSSKRQGTHAVKNRSEVSGGGKKPWKQKGTGRARAGSLRSPIFVGGGKTFGPQPNKNYNLKVNKKVRKLAFCSALTLLAKRGGVLICDPITMEKPKTKDLLNKLNQLQLEGYKKIIIVSNDENVFLSSNNLQNIFAIKLSSLTVEELLWTEALIMSESDVKKLEGMVKK